MSKKDELGPRARDLYVVHHMSLKDIAVRLGVAERTLGNWKSADAETGPSWDEQRGVVAGTEGGLHAELQRLATVTARKLRMDMEDGKDPDDRVYYLDKLLQGAIRSRKLEKDTAKDLDKATPEERRQRAAEAFRKAMGL